MYNQQITQLNFLSLKNYTICSLICVKEVHYLFTYLIIVEDVTSTKD